MADNTQFGSPKVPGNQPGDSAHCAQCEAMLADALDGTLTPADQALFDTHMAHCALCSQMLADARRGAAWLEMLRDPRPEPPASLLEKILAQTSGHPVLHKHSAAAPAPAAARLRRTLSCQPASAAPVSGQRSSPLRSRFANAASALGQIVSPAACIIAMTAAMAFFSIALTMNLTGRPPCRAHHASNLAPSNLQRDFYSANTRVVQYYEGLRVVYELESRVHDLQTTSDTDASRPPTPVDRRSRSTTQLPTPAKLQIRLLIRPSLRTPTKDRDDPEPATAQPPAAQPSPSQSETSTAPDTPQPSAQAARRAKPPHQPPRRPQPDPPPRRRNPRQELP